MSVPTVSVVLIFFNDERFLPEAIDSVLAQTHEDWDLLLVDDGSTDGSTAVAQRFADDLPDRVRYLEHPGHANRGPSAARNLGIRHARGRYVAFLDSDDVWLPVKLAEQASLLDAHPQVGLLVGASLYWWSWAGSSAPKQDRVVTVGAPPDRVHHPPDLIHHLYPLARARGTAPCPSSCIARREVLQGIGGFEEQFRTMYEDQAFLLKAYLTTPVYVSSRCWDQYRRHPDAVTLTTSRPQYRAARLEVLTWFSGYLDTQGVDDPEVRAALHRALWPYRHPVLASLRESAGRGRSQLRRRYRARR